MTTQVPFQPGRHAGQGSPRPMPAPAPSAPSGPGAVPPGSGRNGLATAGFVVALVGFVLALIPIVGTVSWVVSPVGLVLSVVGLALAGRRRAGRGLAVAGVVLGVLGLVSCVVYTASFVSAANGTAATTSVPAASSAGAASTIRYEVTGTGRGSVTYTDGSGNMGQQTSARLPWSKDIKPRGSFGFYSLTVTGGANGGEVGCRIVKDGVVVAEQSAEGEYASASCSGS